MILLLSLLKVRYWLTFFYLIEKKNCLMDILRNLSQRFTEDVLMVLLLFSKRHVLFERTWNLASKILSKILFHSLVWKAVDGDIILFNYRFSGVLHFSYNSKIVFTSTIRVDYVFIFKAKQPNLLRSVLNSYKGWPHCSDAPKVQEFLQLVQHIQW